MDFRTALVICLSALFAGVIRASWENFKKRKAREPIPMKLRKGIYVPWGPVQRIERALNVWLVIWAIYIAALLVALAFSVLM